jgi:hypothetical protein
MTADVAGSAGDENAVHRACPALPCLRTMMRAE